jgi:sulfhydrogenase subunit beta (sulfur reductase)
MRLTAVFGMKQYVVEKPRIQESIEKLLKEKNVCAPVSQDNFANFARIRSYEEIIWGPPQTVIPPKKYFLPTAEDLFSFKRRDGDFEVQPLNAAEEVVLFGVHPCDLNAIYLVDQVFMEKNRDENYLRKREKAVLIGVDCLKPCSPEAICLRMDGLNPRDRFDLFLTDVGDAYFADSASQKGEEALGGAGKPASGEDIRKLSTVRKKRDELFDREEKELLSDYRHLPGLMKENYIHPVWEEHGAKCYGCGSCNMVCPTCYCFDIEDYMKIDMASGVRKRFWDGCMLEDFAKVASGANFREERSDRLRHRTNRKLNYLFDKWGESFCTGCGRCIKACLTSIVSPLEIANEIFQRRAM